MFGNQSVIGKAIMNRYSNIRKNWDLTQIMQEQEINKDRFAY